MVRVWVLSVIVADQPLIGQGCFILIEVHTPLMQVYSDCSSAGMANVHRSNTIIGTGMCQ